ncbi:damage-inducible protein CinA [Alicyclobacillus ferrooxydans]|uniref:Putative competence-damage inducible protein n=1 Tax=Alicyclobacillus ferrooxydans TaxID=471514 RepID=A0A0P9EMV7_9BACL|nr:competence/damage-inducible protein A [Alicyclobacillus ferrooxydans]KPV39880.1 damage-inducible protein CinA [Alicyclobacillus ferrooxydans]
MRGEHIAIGSEILLGQILNAHARTVSLAFAEQGFFLYYHTAVGDNLDRIANLLRQAGKRSNVIVITGGLGPTEDDLTREAVAQVLGRELHLVPDAVAEIERFFAGRGRPMPEVNRKQAMLIDGGEFLPNPNGTAPGQYVESEGVHYFLLPGPPLEMKPMLDNYVVLRLKQLLPNSSVLVSRTLHFCGIGESTVNEEVIDLLALQNPTVAPLASEGEMLLRITASAATAESAQELIAPLEKQLREQFPKYIYGVDSDSLPSVVGDALRARGATLSAAESCTGGLLSSMITAIPGASQYFFGGVVSYDNSVKSSVLGVSEETLKEHGAVSEEAAREMALGVRSACGTTFGVSITGIAGPGGGTAEKPVGLVYIGLADSDGCDVYRLQLRGSREQIRLRAAKQLLWRLWTKLNH